MAERLNRLPYEVYRYKVYGSSIAIPAEDYTYDVIVAVEFIEHIYAGDVDKTLTEIFRTPKSRGRLMHYPDMLKLKLKMIGFSNFRVFGSAKMTRYLGSRYQPSSKKLFFS